MLGVMDEKFLSQLLCGIEEYHENPDTEQLGDLFLTLVLAFNLQYLTLPPPALASPQATEPLPDIGLPNGTEETGKAEKHGQMENLVMKLLAQRQDTKYFTEKLLLLFNREGWC